jgi:GT2 family glycosyltransferase/glycosyltransferase involved in cell wall biosynthesis
VVPSPNELDDMTSTPFPYSDLFQILERTSPTGTRPLGARNEALLRSALAFHALDNPGQELEVVAHMGTPGQDPVLTDERTFDGEGIDDGPVVARVRIRSTVRGTPRERWKERADGSHEPFEVGASRTILLTPDEGVGDRHRGRGLRGAYWHLRHVAERRYPFAYDRVRQVLLRRRIKAMSAGPVERARQRFRGIPPRRPEPGATAAVIIGVHWFELGGAEKWAFETVRLAKEAGLLPIVLSDKPAQQKYLSAPELEGAVCIPLTHPMDQDDREQPLLTALLENFDVRGVFLHHCHWLYDRTPWLKAARPDLPIADSLHILEYSGGGYPAISSHVSDFIDLHHVISPQLDDWYENVQHIPAHKLVMAPLVGLTTGEAAAEFREREPGAPLRVGFIGRFVQQKRPYLFLKLVREAIRRDGLQLKVIMQGEGELERSVIRAIQRMGLQDVIELRPPGHPVAETLAELDCLVLSSQNEGIALTTMEAIAAGVPVISSDVGSQRTIVSPELLVPRAVGGFVEGARAALRRMDADEAWRRSQWQRESALAAEFSEHTPASVWALQLFSEWSERTPSWVPDPRPSTDQGASMTTTAAVVVAYNRVEKLKTVIASIEAQTVRPDWLVVVDNASTDGTAEYLRTLDTPLELVVVSNATNEGGAGGFSDGMERGYALGADFVWIMDDDCYPEPDALEELHKGLDRAVDKLGPDVPFACSLVRYVDGEICEMNNAEPTWDWPRLLSVGDNSVMVTSCSFVSVLFPRWVLEQYGLPYREYFIWFDDAEYTKRVTRVCPGVQVLSSGVVHDMGDNKGVNFGLIDEKNAWKFSYGVRNQGSYRLHHESKPAFLIFAARVAIGMRRGRVARKLQLKMYRQLLAALRFNPAVVYPAKTVQQPARHDEPASVGAASR